MYIALAKDWSGYEDLLMKHIQEQADKMAQVAPFDEDNRMHVRGQSPPLTDNNRPTDEEIKELREEIRKLNKL